MTLVRITRRIRSAFVRFVPLAPVALLAGTIGAAAVPAVPAAPSCGVDAVTGASVPQGVRGICVVTTAERTLLVQRSDEGLLIAALAGDARSSKSVYGTSARVVFCPTSLLDFASGTPTSACLTDAQALRPGPGAFVGFGTVRAEFGVDGTGETRCPTAARVTATVTSPAGERLVLTSAIAMLDEPDRPNSCAAVYDRIELGSDGETPEASVGVGAGRLTVDPRRLDQMLRLDDEQWRVVELLLALTPRDWQVLEAIVRDGSGNGSADTTAMAYGSVGTTSLADVVNTILARVNAIRSTLDALAGRIPDRPEVRDLLGQVDVGRIRDMLGEARDTLQGLVDIARDLRDGYDSFDVAQFRTRIGSVLDDVETASVLYQRLLCVDNPNLTIRHVSTAPLKRLIDRAPGVTLYGLSRILEAIDPDWDQRIREVVAAVPPEVTNFCNAGERPSAIDRIDVPNTVCTALRHKQVGAALGIVRGAVSVALMGFRFAKNHTKEEIQATVGADAGLGATGGTSVKNPVHETVSQWVDRLDNLKDAIKDLIDKRKDCLDSDKDVEHDLMDCAKDGCVCATPLSLLLPGDVQPTYAYVADLVEVRIDQAEAAGLPNIGTARSEHGQAVSATNDEKAAGYGLLCRAYSELLPPTATAPRVSPLPPLPPPRGPRPARH